MTKAIIRTIRSFSISNLLFSFLTLSKAYLKKSGWLLSVKKGIPVDSDGAELPWFTYCSIKFISERLNSKLSVFEYGSGNSTLWFSKRVGEITSVEHDFDWHSKLKDKLKLKSNVNYFFRDLETGVYQEEILNHKGKFDIVIIDGRERIQCTFNSIDALKNDGVIIFDNSDRDSYDEAYSFLRSKDFRRIDFWGLGPINSYAWCTSVFYRENNCFNI